jgi:Na+/melibiose symporter-like transporter
MLMKVLITNRFCRETQRGKIRKAETKGVPLVKMLEEYQSLIPRVLKNKEVMKVIAVSAILHVAHLVNGSFFGLYVTQRLGLADRYLAFFPILNAAVMLIFMVFIQHRLNSVKFRIPMWSGLLIYAACMVLLILTPIGNLPLVIAYVFFGAVANALVGPRKDALLQLNIEAEERARINSMIMAATIAFASPFGYIAGWLSGLDRRCPFIFTFTIFLLAVIIVGRIREPELKEMPD